jgi:hypothetical protein
MFAGSHNYAKGHCMPESDSHDGSNKSELARPPVFSLVIDRLIKEIWELGGMEELRSKIDLLKQLPAEEFESRLVQLRDRLSLKK